MFLRTRGFKNVARDMSRPHKYKISPYSFSQFKISLNLLNKNSQNQDFKIWDTKGSIFQKNENRPKCPPPPDNELETLSL